jgi:hypothetical protein
LKEPSPALVISCVALFASLGGTGYAATQLHSGASAAKSKKAAKALTKSDVNKLIATYVKAHHIGAVGPQGPRGLPGGPGIEGKVGPQGPGAKLLASGLMVSGETTTATIGPWTLSFECKTKAKVEAAIKFAGPGSGYQTLSIGPANAEGKVANDNGPINGGIFAVTEGGQLGIKTILISGSTAYLLEYQSTASAGVPFGTCDVVAVATPVS